MISSWASASRASDSAASSAVAAEADGEELLPAVTAETLAAGAAAVVSEARFCVRRPAASATSVWIEREQRRHGVGGGLGRDDLAQRVHPGRPRLDLSRRWGGHSFLDQSPLAWLCAMRGSERSSSEDVLAKAGPSPVASRSQTSSQAPPAVGSDERWKEWVDGAVVVCSTTGKLLPHQLNWA